MKRAVCETAINANMFQLCAPRLITHSFSKLLCSQCCFSQDFCWRPHLSFNDMVGTVSLVVISHVCRFTQFKYILIRELLHFPKLCAKDRLLSNIKQENSFYFFCCFITVLFSKETVGLLSSPALGLTYRIVLLATYFGNCYQRKSSNLFWILSLGEKKKGLLFQPLHPQLILQNWRVQ